VRWYFGHGIDRVVVLTVEEVRAGVTVENRKGIEVQCEGVCEGYDILGYPFGPMVVSGYDEKQQAEHNRLRAISRDIELINCLAGAYAEAAHRRGSVVGCLLAGGDGDLGHLRTILEAWGWSKDAPEYEATWQLAGARASALVRSPMGSAAIRSIAGALFERGEVDGDEVRALCRTAYGGRECAFGAWLNQWPPTLAQIRIGFIPERPAKVAA
jgi:hypothetical protein